MKKHFRLISALLAACMSLTMVAGAANVSTDETELSPIAGQTVTGTAFVYTPDGKLEDTVDYDVTIPEDATIAEQKEIVSATAAEAVCGQSVTRANGPQWYGQRGCSFPKASSTATTKLAMSVTMPYFFKNVMIQLSDITNATKMNVRLTGDGGESPNGAFDSVCQINLPVDSDNYASCVFVSYKTYNGETFHAYPDEEISVYLSGNKSGKCDLGMYCYN